MRKIMLIIAVMLAAVSFAVISPASTAVVEIFYLPHPPAEAVVRDVEAALHGIKGVEVRKYSFEAAESRKQMARYSIREHTPVMIFINGRNDFVIGNRKIVLKNFPKGNAFVPNFEGNWSYQDIGEIMRSVTGGKA
jgi:hypothetical protein